ncbi:MAG: hypothetical protein LC776_00930, partial [Acidobacteria bacterium]|nr:hypothetical protein [Acidobacteriota bacterium]
MPGRFTTYHYTRRPLITLVAAGLIASALVMVLPSSAAATVTGAVWTAPSSVYGEPVATPTGIVLTEGCTGTNEPNPMVQAIAPTGTVTWSTPTGGTCARVTGDSDGTSYVHVRDGSQALLKAISSNGTEIWSVSTGLFEPTQ